MSIHDPEALGRNTESEIRSMPTVWRALADSVHPAAEEAAAAAAGGPVVLLGCGSGYLAARFGQLLLDRSGTPAVAITASDYVLRPPRHLSASSSGERPVAIALSRSGETSETVSAVRAFRNRGGGTVIAATCRPDSSLAREADLVIDLSYADEVAVPQTRSVSALWLTLLLIAGAASGLDLRQDILRAADDVDSSATTLWASLIDAASSGDAQVLLGSGLGHVLATEAVLKMTEMGRVPAWAHRTLEYRHGPAEALRPGITLVGPFGDDLATPEFAAAEEAAAGTDKWINVPELVHASNGPTALLPQLYTAHAYSLLLSRRQGLDADQPAHIRAHVGDVWLEDADTRPTLGAHR